MDTIFEKYVSNADGTSLLQKDLLNLKSMVTEAGNKNYKPEFIAEIKEGLTAEVIKRYELYRQTELERIGKDIEDIKQTWNKKMVESDQAQKKISILEKSYSALSDEEIENKYKSYIRQELTYPQEHEVLSRALRERKSKNFNNFRKHYIERNDNEPFKKLNPELFTRHENLSKLKYGEALGHVSGKNQQGVDVIIPRYYKIRDLL